MVPKEGDAANVFVGEDEIGELTGDDDEGERSFNFRMVIQVSNDPEHAAGADADQLSAAALRQRQDPRGDAAEEDSNSVEAYIGDEFLGVLFLETERGRKSYIFELPILDVDLVP